MVVLHVSVCQSLALTQCVNTNMRRRMHAQGPQEGPKQALRGRPWEAPREGPGEAPWEGPREAPGRPSEGPRKAPSKPREPI